MRRKVGLLSIEIGVLAIVLAFLLYLHNFKEDKRAGKAAEVLLQEVQTVLSEGQTDEKTELLFETSSADTEDTVEEPDQIQDIMSNEYEYIGVLSLPSLELTLPVLSECSDSLLGVAPCRDYGDFDTGNLVIAAHNYRNHFGRLQELAYGAEIQLTDMNGELHHYTVTEIMIVQLTDVSLVWDSPYELVLYTCDYTNQNRVVVYCKENVDQQ